MPYEGEVQMSEDERQRARGCCRGGRGRLSFQGQRRFHLTHLTQECRTVVAAPIILGGSYRMDLSDTMNDSELMAE